MMDRPHGDELLDAARACLFERLLPALPADRQYEARMVARAMAIASREHRAAPEWERAAAARIRDFYEQHGGAGAYAVSQAGLACYIRHHAVGADAAADRALHALLLLLVRGRLAVSNPRHASGGHHVS